MSNKFINVRITACNETLYEHKIAINESYKLLSEYVKDLEAIADEILPTCTEVVLWVKFPDAKKYCIYRYTTGTDGSYMVYDAYIDRA